MLSPSGKPAKAGSVEEGSPPQLELFGFRGVREVDGVSVKDIPEGDPRRAEIDKVRVSHHLLIAGHVGVSVDGGSTIFGLTPEFPAGMPLHAGIDALYQGACFPGRVADDKPIFDMADQYHREHGWNTNVVSVKRPIETDAHADLKQRLEGMAGQAPGAHGVYYSFPLKNAVDGQWFTDKPGPDGKMVKGENLANCATFPAQVGIELPEASGNLRFYMPALEAEATQQAST
ncbi:MAG: hypothetical protein EP330_13800 [Deltaproteobacteria bacterium]|nr:MAG: hypothetical protein EP330_13800 [Deltaproteobacteria bacterium]